MSGQTTPPSNGHEPHAYKARIPRDLWVWLQAESERRYLSINSVLVDALRAQRDEQRVSPAPTKEEQHG